MRHVCAGQLQSNSSTGVKNRRVLAVGRNLSRKGAKAQRKPFRNAIALCAFAREIFSVEVLSAKARRNSIRNAEVNSLTHTAWDDPACRSTCRIIVQAYQSASGCG